MDVIHQWIAFREHQNNEEAVQLLNNDCSFETPNETVKGREAILAFLNVTGFPKDGPVFDKDFVEASPGVFVRGATVKRMMMTVKLSQTITLTDGKITSIVLKR